MYDSNSKGISYVGGFFMLIGFAIAGLFLASMISIPIWTAMTGKSILEMSKALTDPANSNAVKVIQVLQTVFGFFIPAIFTAYLLNRKPMKLIGFTGKITAKQVGVVIAIMLTALLVSAFFSYINEKIPISESWRISFQKMEDEYNKQVEAIIGLNNLGQYFLALFIMAFLPALCEETLFRGGLQNYLSRATKMPWLSIIIVSILFSLAHFSYFGFLSRFFLGVILGLIYQYSGKIWLNIIAHFFNNALALSAIYYFKLHGKPVKDAIDDTSNTWVGVFAIPVLIGLLYFFYKIAGKKPPEETMTLEELKEKPFHGA
jgi:membrane protease YdiL (CAAX protease family)